MQCAQIFSTSLIHCWNGIKVTVKLQHREVMCMKPLSINSIHAFRNKTKQCATLKWTHEPQRQGNFTEQRHMWVGYNTCYNEEWIGTPPRTLMVVPNVTTHPPRIGGRVGLCTQPASYLLKFSTVHRVRMKPATSEICWVLRPLQHHRLSDWQLLLPMLRLTHDSYTQTPFTLLSATNEELQTLSTTQLVVPSDNIHLRLFTVSLQRICDSVTLTGIFLILINNNDNNNNSNLDSMKSQHCLHSYIMLNCGHRCPPRWQTPV